MTDSTTDYSDNPTAGHSAAEQEVSPLPPGTIEDTATDADFDAANVSGPGTGLDGELPSVPEHPALTPEQQAIANKVEDCLYDVVDPELGINVVDLGLVYDIWVEDESSVVIYMTLTSPACPLTDVLEDQSADAVVGSGAVDNMRIQWVWSPPWGPHMITEEGREQLRALGFSV